MISVMYKLTRTVLTWLLMFAIPVQGFAATAMLFCAHGHHSTVARAISQSPISDHHAGLPAQAGHQHGDQAKLTSASQSSDLSVAHVASAKIGKVADGKCSACATCCTGSIIVSTQSFSHVAMTSSERISFIQESFVNYTPEGLDPPPKSFLA